MYQMSTRMLFKPHKQIQCSIACKKSGINVFFFLVEGLTAMFNPGKKEAILF